MKHCLFVATLGLISLTASTVWASHEAERILQERIAQQPETEIKFHHRIESLAHDWEVNDDGSISIAYPELENKLFLFSESATQLDPICRHYLGNQYSAAPLSAIGGGFLSETLGIPHVPDSYDSDKYVYFASQGPLKTPIKGREFLKMVACYPKNRTWTPISKSYDEIKFMGLKAEIKEPRMRWNDDGLTRGHRRISARNELSSEERQAYLDQVCKLFGFDRQEGRVKVDTDIVINWTSLELDLQGRVSGVRNSRQDHYIDEIICKMD